MSNTTDYNNGLNFARQGYTLAEVMTAIKRLSAKRQQEVIKGFAKGFQETQESGK